MVKYLCRCAVAARLTLALAILFTLSISPAWAGPDAPAAISVKLEQCANGGNNENPSCDPLSGSDGWVNGNVNGNKAKYGFGEFLPYRYVIDGLVNDATYCFGMGWDITDQGYPALDYIGTFNHTLTQANPLYDTEYENSDSPASPDATVLVPADPALAGQINGNPFTGSQQNGVISAWGANSLSIDPVNNYSNLATADLGNANNSQSLQFCFTTTAATMVNGQVVISWAAHIAQPSTWGFNTLPSGSPYHTRTGTETIDTPGFWSPRNSSNDFSQTVNVVRMSQSGPNALVTTHTNIGSQEVQLAASAIPLAMMLSDFSAACVGSTPVVSWETASELNNRGFNLWRGLNSSTPDTQLNALLIPSQSPGSATGFSYSWTDNTAAPDTTYYYWIDDVDLNGLLNRHGPVSVFCSSPTALTLTELRAESVNSSNWLAVLASLLLLTLILLTLHIRRTAP